MSDPEVSHEESMLHAIKFMQRNIRRELRDARHLKNDARHEEKDSKHHDTKHEIRDAEKVENDIYHFLYHNIRVMNALIEVERDQDFVENQEHIHNEYKSKIAREVNFLLQELRRIGALDRQTR